MVFIHAKVGPKGQVVIPKPFRDEYGMSPGAEVTFEEEYVNGEKKLVVEKTTAKVASFVEFLEKFAGKHGKKLRSYDSDAAYEEMMEERLGHAVAQLRKERKAVK